MEREQEAYAQTQHHLPEHLELSGHARFVFLEHFDIVVDEAYQAQPKSGDKHCDHIDIVQLGQQQCGQHYGCQYQQPSHGGGALFFFLSFKTKAANRLAYRLAANETDKGFAAKQHYQQ